MHKLINIKSWVFLLVFIGLIPVLFFIVWSINQLMGADGIELSLLLFFGGFFGYFLFWLYSISYGLELLNIDLDIPSNLKKSRRLIVVLLITYMIRIILSLTHFNSLDSNLIVVVNIILGLLGFFVLVYLLYLITEDYIFHVKGRMPRLFDYFIMLFHFGFFPVGLIILHSHVRLMLKDKNLIE